MSTRLTDLLDKRSNVQSQMREHLDKTESGELDTAAEETYTRYHRDLCSLDEQINAESDMVKRNAAAEAIRAEHAVKNPAPKAPQSDNDVLRSMARGEKRSHEFPIPSESRDQLVGTNSAGGFTLRTDFYTTLVENLRVNAGLLRLNPTILRTDGGNTIQIPRVTTHPSAAWISEGAVLTESDAVFAQSSLSAFKSAFSVQISTELEQDTSVNLMEYLARRGGEAIGNNAGAGYVTGTGSGQPTGVTTQSTLGVTGGSGVAGVFTADNLIDLYFSVIEPYRMSPSAGWLMNDTALGTVRKLKESTSGRYLFDVDAMIGRGAGLPGPDAPISGFLLGKPVVTDPNVAVPALSAKSVLFGDWRAYFVRFAGPIRVERSTEFAFQNDLVTWRFVMRTDGKLIDTSGAIKHFIGNAA